MMEKFTCHLCGETGPVERSHNYTANTVFPGTGSADLVICGPCMGAIEAERVRLGVKVEPTDKRFLISFRLIIPCDIYVSAPSAQEAEKITRARFNYGLSPLLKAEDVEVGEWTHDYWELEEVDS